MNLRRYVPCMALAMFGFAATLSQAHAATTTITGTFSGDNSVYSDPFSVSSTTNYTFTTTSAAAGNFLPTLTLFNVATGAPVDFNDGTYPGGDVSLSDTLGSGSYDLFLTEYPNVAVGNLNDGFIFSSDPTATGDFCGGALSGESFVNAQTCGSALQLGNSYTLVTSATPAGSIAVTPEPSTFLLMLAPAAGLVEMARRRRLSL